MASWFELSIETPPALSDILASFLFDLGSSGLESVDRADTVLLKAFFLEHPPAERLRTFCRDIGSVANPPWKAEFWLRKINEEDWGENWKLHFQPICVGRFCICPPWNSNHPVELIPIVIEPGMAFGTGQHPTTKGCLELIELAATRASLQRALDVGTGSGILAIALAKLGVGEVCAIDNDPIARRVATENVSTNGCSSAIRILSSWPEAPASFDLVVANLYSQLLHGLSSQLTRCLRPGGAFICSGFLEADEAIVVDAYSSLAVEHRRSEDSWMTLLMRRSEA